MPQSLSYVLIHLVFSTKNRLPYIHSDVELKLYRYITSICNHLECPPHQIGGMPDHIHILLSLSRNVSQSKLVNDVKSNSSRWMKKQGKQYEEFSWQNGYGAFSIGKSSFDAAIQYIACQKKHHQTQSFQEEYRVFLQKYEMDYDERYVWD